MSWELAANLGDEMACDVAWATVANSHNEYIAIAQGRRVVVWQLTGRVDNLQVSHCLEHLIY